MTRNFVGMTSTAAGSAASSSSAASNASGAAAMGAKKAAQMDVNLSVFYEQEMEEAPADDDAAALPTMPAAAQRCPRRRHLQARRDRAARHYQEAHA